MASPTLSLSEQIIARSKAKQRISAKLAARTILAIAKDPSICNTVGYWGFTTPLDTEPLAGHIGDSRKIGVEANLTSWLTLLVARYSKSLVHAGSALEVYHYYLSTYSPDKQAKLLTELINYEDLSGNNSPASNLR